MPFPSPTPKPPVKSSLVEQALSRLDANKVESTPDYSGVVNPYYDSAAIENVTIVDTPQYSSKDLESFHKYHTNFNTVDNPYQQRADNQSWQEQLGATIYNMPINIVAGLVENVGYLGTLGETDDDKDYTNSLVQLGKELRNWGGNGQEVYQNPKDDLDLSDSGFWFNMAGGLVESIAEFYLTGAGVGAVVGKGTGALAELATIGKGAKNVDKAGDFLRYVQKAKNLTDRTLTASSLSYTEGAMSGADVYTKVKDKAQKELDREVLEGQVNQKAIEKGYKTNEEYSKAIAAESAATTVRLNTMINTTLNLTSVGAFFPSVGQQLTFNKSLNAALQQIDDKLLSTTGRTLTQEEKKYAIKNLINKTDDSGDNLVAKIIKDNNVSVAYKPTNGILEGYHVGAEMLQESVEEIVNELATKAGERAGENEKILDGDLTDKYLRAFTQLESKDAFSKEAVVAAVAGAVGGGGQTSLTRYVALTKKPDYETYQAPVMTANDNGEIVPTEQTTLERRRKTSSLGTSPGGREDESSSRKSNYQQEQEDSKFYYDQAKQDVANQLAFVEKQQDLINAEKQKEPHLIDWNKVNALQEEMFTRVALSRAVRTGNGEFLINTLQNLHDTDNTKDLGVEYNKQFVEKRNELLGGKNGEDVYTQKQETVKALSGELKSNQVQNVAFGPDYNSVAIDRVDSVTENIINNTKKIEQLSSAIQKANTPTQKAKLNQQIKDLQNNINQDTDLLNNIKSNVSDEKIQEYISLKEELLSVDSNPELIQLERTSKEFRGKTEAMVKGLTNKADNISTGVVPSADYKEKANRLTNAIKKGSQRWETINGLYNKGEIGDDEYVNELWTLTQLSDVYLEQADKYGYNTPEYQLYKSKVDAKKLEITDILSNPDKTKEAEDFTTNWKTKLNKSFEGGTMPENLKKLALAKDTTEFLEGMKGNEDMLAIEELYSKPFQEKYRTNLNKAISDIAKSTGLENINLEDIITETRNQTLKDVNDESKSLIFAQKADRAYKQYQNLQARIDKLNTSDGKTEFVNNQKELVSKQMAKQKAIYEEQKKIAEEAKKKENSKDLAAEVRENKKPASLVTNPAATTKTKTALEEALENISGKKETTETDTSDNKAVAKKKSTGRKAKSNKETEDKINEEKIAELNNELKKATSEKKALEAQLQKIAQGKDKPLTDETLNSLNKTNDVIEELQEKVSTYRKNKYQELAESFNTDAANEEAILFNQEENELAGVNELAENENRNFYKELQDRFKEQVNFSYSDKDSGETKSFRKLELVAGEDIIPIEELNVENISTGDILVWSWEGRKDEEDYENPRNAVNSVIGEVSRNKKGEIIITVAKDSVTKVVDGQELTTPNFMTINTSKEGVIIYGVRKRIEGKENYIAGVEVSLQNGKAELISGQDTIDNILETFTEKSEGKTYWSGIVSPYKHEDSLDRNFVLFPTVFKLERKSTDAENKEVWQTETHSFNNKEVEDYYISNDDFAVIANTIDRGTFEMLLRANPLLTTKAVNNIENRFYENDKAYINKTLSEEMTDKFLNKWASKDEIPSDTLAKAELLQAKALELLSILLPEENTRKLVREKSKHLDKSQYFSISTKTLLDEEIAAKLDEYGLASTTPIMVKVKGDVEYFAIAVGRQNNSIVLLSKDGNIFNVPSKNIEAIIRPKDDNFQKILTDKREDGFKTINQIKKDRANKNIDTSNLDYIKQEDKSELREKSPFVESVDNLMLTYLTGKKLEDYEANSEEGSNVFFQLGYLRYVKTVIKNSDTEADVKKEHITTINNAINEIVKGELWKNTITKMRKVVNQLQQGDFVVVNTKNEDDSRSNKTYMFIEPTTVFGGWTLEVGKDIPVETGGYKFEKSKENNLKWISFQDDYTLSNYQFYRTKDNRPTTIGYNYNQELSKTDIKDKNSYVHENYNFSSLNSMEQIMSLKEGDLISVTNIGKDDVRHTGYKIIKNVESSQDKEGETVYKVTYFTGKGLYTISVDVYGQNDNTQVLGFGIRRVDNQKKRKLIMERFLAKTRKKESIIQIPNEGNISIPTSLQWYGYKSRIINEENNTDKEYWEYLQEGDVVVYEVGGNTYIRPVANVVSDQTFYNMDGDKGNMKTLVVYTTPKNGDFTSPITLSDNKAQLNPNKPVEIITKSYPSRQIKIKAVFYAPHNFKTISKEISELDKERYQEYKDKSNPKPSKKAKEDKDNKSIFTKEQFQKDINKNNDLESSVDISENTELAEDIQDSTELRKGEQGDNYTQGHPLDNGNPISELEEAFANYMQNFFDNKNEKSIEKFASSHKLKVVSPNTKEGKALYDKYYGEYDWAKDTSSNRPILTVLVTNSGELVVNENQVPIVSQITTTKAKDKGTQQEKVRKGIIETWKKDSNADIMLELNKNYPVKSGTKNWLKDGLRPLDKWEQATNEKLDIAVAKPQAAGQTHSIITTKAGTNRKISSGHAYSILHDKIITYYSNTIAEMKPELVGKVSNTVLATLLFKLNGEDAITTDTGQIIKYWQNLDDIFFTGIAMRNGNPVYADNSDNIPIYELAVLRPKDNPPYLLMRGITKLDNFEELFGKYDDVFEKVEVDGNTFIKITPVKSKGKFTFNSNQLEFLKTFIGQKQFNINSINLSKDNVNFELLNYSQEVTPNTYPVKANLKLEDQGITYQEFLKENVLMTDVTIEPLKLKARGFIYGDIISPNVKAKSVKTEETKEAEIVTTGPTVISTFGKNKKSAITEETENTGPTVVGGFGKAKIQSVIDEKEKMEKEVENTGPTVVGGFGKIKIKPEEKVTVKFGKDKENFKECTGKKSGSNRVDKINLDE